MIIALAGHVDHGKTSIIRALTGIETDRLQQEVERGLTIDLGFAYADIDGQPLGFVDVPGHHRFVHNMLAGVSRHQCAMLVIAADDGIMPQTREHLAIMQLLGLQQGLVVLNKVDRVSDEQRAAVTRSIEATLADSFLAGAPIIPIAAISGVGIPELRAALAQLGKPSATRDAATSTEQHSRLPIDRAFTYRGVGTIVTGTLHTGSLSVDQEIALFPLGRRSRIRSLRANDQAVDTAMVGDRVAVNLAGVEAREVVRGMWLHSGPAAASYHQVIELAVLEDFPRPIRHWSRVHAYHGSSHRLAQLALLDRSSIQPGESALVELICDEPLLTIRGDRLIVRDHGLDQTLGGGAVISTSAPAGRRREPSRLDALALAQEPQSIDSAFTDAVSEGWLSLTEFAALWGTTEHTLTALTAGHELTQVGDYATTTVCFDRAIETALEQFNQQLAAQSADGEGLLAQDFCTPNLAADEAARKTIQDAMIKRLVADKRIVLRSGRYHQPNSAPALSPQEAELLTKIARQLQLEPPPSLGDIGKTLRIPAEKLRKAVLPLAGKGHLVLFGANRLMLPAQFQTLAALAVKLESDGGPFTVKAFRDASGLGRNLVIDVLEHMDAGGYTRRLENTRTVVGDLSRIIKS